MIDMGEEGALQSSGQYSAYAYKRQTTCIYLNKSTGVYSIGIVRCIGDVIVCVTIVSKWVSLRCLGCTWIMQLIELICVRFTNKVKPVCGESGRATVLLGSGDQTKCSHLVIGN